MRLSNPSKSTFFHSDPCLWTHTEYGSSEYGSLSMDHLAIAEKTRTVLFTLKNIVLLCCLFGYI